MLKNKLIFLKLFFTLFSLLHLTQNFVAQPHHYLGKNQEHINALLIFEDLQVEINQLAETEWNPENHFFSYTKSFHYITNSHKKNNLNHLARYRDIYVNFQSIIPPPTHLVI
jgi:hypothetical protein